MKIAVISDIHGNMEAFTEVLADIDGCAADAVVCLGDMVGYGPEPEAVVRTIRDRGIPTIMGNHEMALIDRRYLSWFNPAARRSIEMSLAWFSEASLGYIARLKHFLIKESARFVHGFPPDAVITYLFQVNNQTLRSSLANLREHICFVGHTHQLMLVSYDGRKTIKTRLHKGLVTLEAGAKYIVNVGSVGQPRDGNHDAKYTLWDTVAGTIETKFIPYHIARVTNKIIEAGLPSALAERLW